MFAVTGATGLLGSNIVWEILRANLYRLDRIKILWLGRGWRGATLRQRISAMLREDGAQYFLGGQTPDVLAAAEAAIVPIEADLAEDGLGLSAIDLGAMAKETIDYFVHCGGSTDLRSEANVESELDEVICRGTQRILDLLGSLPRGANHLAFVSTAFVCGESEGHLLPDAMPSLGRFRNPYEEKKLFAEKLWRTYSQQNRTPYSIFRPTVICGRTLERPLGHVTKFDTFYGWVAFFLSRKKRVLGDVDWPTLIETPVELPIRIALNADGGLNIVPCDLCAKTIYAALVSGVDDGSYHLASKKSIPNVEMVWRVMELLRLERWTVVDEPPSPADWNSHEHLYYRTVGAILTPYMSGKNMVFDLASMDQVLSVAKLPRSDVDGEAFSRLLEFAKPRRFGLRFAERASTAERGA